MRDSVAAVLASFVVCGCGNAPLWTQAPTPPQAHHIGTVVRVGEVPTVNTASQGQRSAMGMYGAAGAAAIEIFGTQQGYPVYRVKVDDDLELVVSSRAAFALGDCVQVSYPAEDKRRYFGLGEAAIAKASGCPPVKAE